MKNYFLILSLIVLSSVAHVALAQQPTAKLIFSKTIDGSEESSFTSADFIYARIAVTNGTLDGYFGILANKAKYPTLRTKVWINFDGKNTQGHPFEYLLLKGLDSTKTIFHFDILPDPSKATSVIASVPDFRYVLSNSTFANSISDQTFSKEGSYTIEISVIGETKDAWGKKGPDVVLKGGFKLDFRFTDIPKITGNTKAANELVKNSAFVLDKLPSIFTKNVQSSDPKLTRAKIAAILKRDLPARNILKFAIVDHKTTWEVMKNGFGIPTYRYFVGNIYFVYKEGSLCKIDNVYLREDYIGGGKYGALKVGGGGGGDVQLIQCTGVK